jgi:TolB-like protein/Tfp pilus assembly protein PilF
MSSAIAKPSKPTAEEIYDQLERILASEEFHSPERGRKFLQFIISEALAGRSEFLKAFTIANEVFGRQVNFDAQNDPVVRIEAGRVRRALERYYLIAGQADEVTITIPKGGYRPCFEYAHNVPTPSLAAPQFDLAPAIERHRDTGPLHSLGQSFGRPQLSTTLTLGTALLLAAASLYIVLPQALSGWHQNPSGASPTEAAEPRVIVESFEDEGSANAASDIARGLRDEIIGKLAKFDDIVVVADASKAEQPSPNAYGLQGNVQLDGPRLRLVARLVRQSDGAVIWANNYDADLRAQSKLEILTGAAEEIASTVAEPYGAVFQADTDALARHPQSGDADAYACRLAYYSYRRSMNAQTHNTARDCLQRATELFPKSAASWALLSLTYLDEMRFRYKLGTSSTDETLELAASAAERAASLAPNDARVLEALMQVSFFRNDVDKALQAGAAAYAMNPNDTEVAGEYGLRLAMSGKWQSGCELISSAVNKNAGPRGYYQVGMALCALMRNDVRAAELWSRMSDLEYNPTHHLVLLSILGTAGKTADARQEREWLNAHASGLMKNIRKEVSLRLQRPEDQEAFFKGLRAAGVAIQPAADTGK